MAQLRRIRVLINPGARRGRAPRSLERAGLLSAKPEGARVEWITSRSSAHFAELVEQAQADDLDAIGLAGGDGTVAMAAGALSRPNKIPFGILPIGSGNDFAADVGVPRDLTAAFSVLLRGEPRRVDIGRAGALARGGDAPTAKTIVGAAYCCVASVGLDELALRTIHASRLPRSKALNIYASLRALLAYRPRRARLTWEGGSFEGELMFAAVTNTQSYGGGFRVSPAARLDDGLLDLCIFRRAGRARLIGQLPKVLRGTHGGVPEVLQAKSPWVRVEGDGAELPFTLDGELPRAETPVELRCEPGGLVVLAPPRKETERCAA